jgi:hypothetical protein
MKYIQNLNEHNISTNLKYHIDNGISLVECVFMIGSDAYCDVINEARELYKKGLIDIQGDDLILVERLKTGTEALYNGKKVKLDVPKRGGKKKFIVYHDCGRRDKDNNIIAKKIEWGDPNADVANWDDKRRKSFLARHKCSEKKDMCTAGWFACNVHLFAKQLGLKSSKPW